MRKQSYTNIKCLLRILEYVDRSRKFKDLKGREGVFLRRVIYKEIYNQLEDESSFHRKVIDLIRYILYLIISLINTSSQTCKRTRVIVYNLVNEIINEPERAALSEYYT